MLCDIHMRPIWPKVPVTLNRNMCSEITISKLLLHLSGANNAYISCHNGAVIWGDLPIEKTSYCSDILWKSCKSDKMYEVDSRHKWIFNEKRAGALFTNELSIIIQIPWQFHFTPTQIVTKWSAAGHVITKTSCLKSHANRLFVQQLSQGKIDGSFKASHGPLWGIRRSQSPVEYPHKTCKCV